VAALGRLPGTRLRGVSALYETDFVGPGEQDPFLNACVVVETEASPEELLEYTQQLERAAGREPDSHMQPRTLDIDLLVHGESRRDGERLQLPHPRMGERRFVLQPLSDLDPELTPPGTATPVRDLLAAPELAAQRIREVAGDDWWEEEV
jgi:2-amino-4-hydroxy-6-hydroxymethyldihydropteridine diphosphokinase